MNLPGDQLLMAGLLRPLIADDFYCYDTGGKRHRFGERQMNALKISTAIFLKVKSCMLNNFCKLAAF